MGHHREISRKIRYANTIGHRPAFHPLAQGRSSHWKAKLPGQEESGMATICFKPSQFLQAYPPQAPCHKVMKTATVLVLQNLLSS